MRAKSLIFKIEIVALQPQSFCFTTSIGTLNGQLLAHLYLSCFCEGYQSVEPHRLANIPAMK